MAKQLLAQKGVLVGAHIFRAAGIPDQPYPTLSLDAQTLLSPGEKDFPVLDDAAGEQMRAAVEKARLAQDSVGGIVECGVIGMPAGIGSPMFDGLENGLASLIFGIPAVKGLEFGDGFAAADLLGSQNNDPFCIRDGKVSAETNHAGGILGGISNGLPILLRVAFKPTPSISQTQQTVDFKAMTQGSVNIRGRHDPCIVARAVPVVEAAAALALADAFLSQGM